jgi:hypothetical protein
MSAVTFKHLPQPLRSHIRSFGTIGQLFKIAPFSAQKSHSAGGRGVPGRISNEPGRKKERKRTIAIYSGHLRLCQQPRAAHALRSYQFLIAPMWLHASHPGTLDGSTRPPSKKINCHMCLQSHLQTFPPE